MTQVTNQYFEPEKAVFQNPKKLQQPFLYLNLNIVKILLDNEVEWQSYEGHDYLYPLELAIVIVRRSILLTTVKVW